MSLCNRVLVVAAHPDDEALGCGGAIAFHSALGDSIDIIFVADGVTSRGMQAQESGAHLRRRDAALNAAAILGASTPSFLDFPDQKLDEVGLLTITKAIEDVAGNIKPTIVYTHYADDLNLDHRLVCEATMTAFRPVPASSVRSIYGFEVLSSTGWRSTHDAFNPNRFVDISSVLKQKREALHSYNEEMRSFPHARSYDAVEALARFRGANVGLEAAEAFVVYREVIK